MLDVRLEDGGSGSYLSVKECPSGEKDDEQGDGKGRQPGKSERSLSESGVPQRLGDGRTRPLRVTHRPSMEEWSKYHLSDDRAEAPAKGNRPGFSTMDLDAATLRLYSPRCNTKRTTNAVSSTMMLFLNP